MTPDEVMRLRPPKKEGDGESEIITEPGDMLIFVSGHFPILGMQMLYFVDPELKRRAAIPPQAALQSLAGGVSACQKPINQTNNVLSKPEAVTNEDATSHLERGFLEELQSGN